MSEVDKKYATITSALSMFVETQTKQLEIFTNIINTLLELPLEEEK